MEGESHAGTACLLLGLSGMGTSPAAAPDDANPARALDPGPPLAEAVVSSDEKAESGPKGYRANEAAGAGAAGVEPVCTPAAVAAALMSALPLPQGEAPPPSAVMPAAASGSLTDLFVNKQRRMQVSALPRKEWSAEEDLLIRSGVEQLGCRWRVIAAQLPGRSDDAVRNRWSRLQEAQRGPGVGEAKASSSRRVSKEGGVDPDHFRKEGGSFSPRLSAADGTFSPSTSVDSKLIEGDRKLGGSPSSASSGEGSSAMRVEGGAHEARRTHSEGGAAMPDLADLASSSSSAASGLAADDSRAPSAGRPGGGRAGGCSCAESGGASASRGTGGGVKPRGPKSGRPSREGNEGEGGAGKKERTSWTRAEDDIIVRGVAELGHKWYEIARRLPGRTDHAIRNRWSRLQSIMGMQESLQLDAAARVLPPAVAAASTAPIGAGQPAVRAAAPAHAAAHLTPPSRLEPVRWPPSLSPGLQPQPSLSPHSSPRDRLGALPPPPPPNGLMPANAAAADAGGSVAASSPATAATASATPLSIAALANVERLPRSGAERGREREERGTGGMSAMSAATVGSMLYSSLPPKIISNHTSHTSAYTSAGSDGSAPSDAELTTGTAELLLLQSGSCSGSGGASSCQPSPHLGASARPAEDLPDMDVGPSGGAVAEGSAAELLLLNKRPRV